MLRDRTPRPLERLKEMRPWGCCCRGVRSHWAGGGVEATDRQRLGGSGPQRGV